MPSLSHNTLLSPPRFILDSASIIFLFMNDFRLFRFALTETGASIYESTLTCLLASSAVIECQ